MKLASLCYLRHHDHLLMLHRTKKQADIHEGKWSGLGGKLLPGESPECGARREVREESGLDLRTIQLAGLLTFPLFDGRDDWYVYLFTGTPEAADGRPLLSEPLFDCPEGVLRWIPEAELLSLPLWPGDRIFLRLLLSHRFFAATFRYQNGELVSHAIELLSTPQNP